MDVGSRIDGRYEVQSVLASGGMATVFVVRHLELGSLHALKVLHIPSPDFRQRLLQEGRLQAKLRHPNIVAVSDTLEMDGNPAIVMEYVDGPALDQWLRGPTPLDQAERLFLGILAAVDHAHRMGVVHRDLKPANVLLAPLSGGHLPKVADFGIAKVVKDVLDSKDAGRVKTRSGMMMGTPAYMAPEQIESAAQVGPQADIFALGCILYELVLGRPAFVGAHVLALLTKSREGYYDDPARIDPDLPPRVVEAIRGSLVPEPTDRIQSCADLARILTDGRVNTLSGTGEASSDGPFEASHVPYGHYPKGQGSDAGLVRPTMAPGTLDDLPDPGLKPEGTPATAGRSPASVPTAPVRTPTIRVHRQPLLPVLVLLGLGLSALALGGVAIAGIAGFAWWQLQPRDVAVAEDPVVVTVPEPAPDSPEPAPTPSPASPAPVAVQPSPAPATPVAAPQPAPMVAPPSPSPAPAPAAPTPTPQPIEAGTPGGWQLQVHSHWTAASTAKGAVQVAAAPKQTLLLVDVTVHNGTEGDVEPMLPFRLQLAGSAYETSSRCNAALPKAMASDQEFRSGRRTRGTLCFEVPKGARTKGATLSFSSGLEQGPQATSSL
ncbi:MAG: protein kinase [Myxococcales bacterium]|nr:protein kinase [Myxococcales bacterium]